MDSGIVIGAIILCVLLLTQSFHVVPEGHVGVYFRAGALRQRMDAAGFHVKLPIDTAENVQVTMQTDQVLNIPCGTSGGVTITFDRIEVVNQLRPDHVYSTVRDYGVNYDKMWIFDKIHHEINQFCSRHTLQEVAIDKFDTLDESLAKALQDDCDKFDTGVRIVAVRVTKPVIPDSVRRNFEEKEAERAALAVARERALRSEAEAATRARQSLIHAQAEKDVHAVTIARAVMEKEGQQRIAEIENAIMLASKRNEADAALYVAQRLAEANALVHTPQYLYLEMVRAVASQSKVFYGDRIPAAFGGLSFAQWNESRP
jgi:regulator of protease activity HflC (stomatin/prohibitin superfamily)